MKQKELDEQLQKKMKWNKSDEFYIWKLYDGDVHSSGKSKVIPELQFHFWCFSWKW